MRRPAAEEVEEGGVRLGERLPGLRPARVDDGVAADHETRQAKTVGGQFDSGGILGGEAEEIGRGDARGENFLPPEGETADLGVVRPAGAEGGAARSVVEALAQALDHPLAGQAGQRLGDGREG